MKMTCLEFRTEKNENDLSSVQDQKKIYISCLEYKTKKKLKLVVLSSRPKKMKKSCLEVKTIKNKGEVLRSRLKILRNFRSKNGFY